jgi:hypothetical protein
MRNGLRKEEFNMKKLFVPFFLAITLLLVLFGVLQVVHAQDQGSDVALNSETQDENTRQITVPDSVVNGANAPSQPLIGFIDSPTAACVQPDYTKNVCYINWYYLSVSADPNYMITMTVQLNDFGYVARYTGFFQTSMYVPYNMNPQGYKVACGAPGVSGLPGWGKTYAYTIRARDSAGLASANYGTAVCPPYAP